MKTRGGARAVAVRALSEIERRDSFADETLNKVLGQNPALPEKDRALATMLVYGVLRRRNALDCAISAAYGRPLKKLHPVVLTVLRAGAAQILFLDRIPDRSAVFEAVELVGQLGHEKAKGLVNAVLRKIAAEGFSIPEAAGFADKLALETGFPEWLIEFWAKEVGEKGAEEMARSFSEIPPIFLRVDTSKVSLDEALSTLFAAKASGKAEYSPEGAWLEGGGDPRNLETVLRGLAVPQAQASQLVPLLLAPKPGWRVLDACAAPGLKTAHIARLMGDEGEIIALDIHPKRAAMTGELARRLGLESIRAVAADAATFDSPEPFDGVLVDAPCSGLGVLSHNPEKRWRLSPEKLREFPPLQSRILKNSARMVKPGGVLVYATCTTAREENEGVVEGFLRENPGWEVESAAGFLPPALVSEEGWMRTYPRVPPSSPGGHLDGFFAAKLLRRR